jgi:hypothetical protein
VDERVTALVVAFAVQSDVAHDVHARSISGQQEHRHALIGADIGLVTTMTIRNEAVLALDEKYFQLLITQSPFPEPSRLALVVNCVGSAPPCGSVIE